MAKRMRQLWKRRRRDSLTNLRATRRRHLVPVDQPLVLISQVSRSGGTLLSQLFAGHPECHVRPGELLIGRPKDCWPELDLSAGPRRWFGQLYEEELSDYAREGYVKVPRRLRKDYRAGDITFPFAFLPRLMESIFRQRLERGATRQREVLDAYFTAFFNAWLDYQELYTPKRWLVAFTPKLSSRADSVERFFDDYPDGRLISCVRDPRSWFVSLRGKRPDLTPAETIARWTRSTEAALENKRRHGDRVRLVSFETLLEDTSGTIRRLADWLEIRWDETLLRPTFQALDIRANSSWSVKRTGVLDAPLRRAHELDANDLDAIESASAKLHDDALRAIERER